MKGILNIGFTPADPKLIIATILAGVIARQSNKESINYVSSIRFSIELAQELNKQLEKLEEGESID